MSEKNDKDRGRLDAFEKELAADPRSLVFVALADEHNRLGEFDEAAVVAQKGLVYHPDSVAGRVALAQAEAGRNNIKQALEQLKRALLIDQENAKALALMGRILLQRGLAKRAMQFLSHAVKLAPEVAEYSELLKRARKGAQQESAPPPVLKGDAVKDSASPWAEGDSESDFDAQPSDKEHTVFDPEALKKLRSRDAARAAKDQGPGESLDEALRNLPMSAIDDALDAEPTRYDGRARKSTVAASTELPPPRRVGGSADADGDPFPPNEDETNDGREEPTTYSTKNPLQEERRRAGGESIAKKKPKVGGSAADFSRMMKSVGASKVEPIPAPSVLNGGAGPATDDLSLGASPPPSGNPPESETVFGRPRSDPPAIAAASLREDKPKTSSKPVAPPPPPPPDAEAPVAKAKSEPAKPVEPAPEPAAKVEKKSAPEKPAAEEPKEVKPPEAKADKPEKAEKPEKPAKAEKPPKAEKEAAKPANGAPEGTKAIGPASTRMVDEALWALLGGKAEPSSEPKPVVPIERDKKEEKPAAKEEKKPASPKAAAAKKEEKEAPEKAAAAPGQMVVRTSERFGVALRAAVMLVLTLSALWIGYALGVSRMGPGPEIASEEVKGIASDLEKGGLAALLAGEDDVLRVQEGLPQLHDLFSAALAEIYARRWASFGRDPEMLAKAKEKIRELEGANPTVELLAAMVIVSTSAKDRAAIDKQLAQTLEEYPESPKSWMLRAKIAAADGRVADAENALYTARSINPQHRGTLLELARWHAKNGGYGAAFNYFDQLQTAYPNDVEVAIERYVLGQLTGRDPAEAQAAATLAGLVREELADVAKDETGRVALAFATAQLARGELTAGVEELGKADAAYRRSAEFKATLAGMFLSVGEWDRARKQYASALEIEPNNTEYRVGIARATYGERAGLRADPEQVKKAAVAARKASEGENKGVAILPFGRAHFVFGKFALVDVEPNKEFFPEAAYAMARRSVKGPELQKALEAASIVALANLKLRTNAIDEATALLEEASKLSNDAAVQVAFGRLHQAKKDNPSAVRAFKRALELDKDNTLALVGLAGALAKENDLVGAIELLEKVEASEVVSVPAMTLLAKIRVQRGDDQGALKTLDTLGALAPNDPNVQLLYGDTLHRMKKSDRALEVFGKLLESKAKIPEKLSNVSMLYLGRLELERNEKRGLALLEKSANSEEAPDEAHFYYGKALIKKKPTKKKGKKELEIFKKLVTSGELSEEADRLLR